MFGQPPLVAKVSVTQGGFPRRHETSLGVSVDLRGPCHRLLVIGQRTKNVGILDIFFLQQLFVSAAEQITKNKDARAAVISVISDLGLRGVDAGVLKNAIALESLTPVLLHINRRYESVGSGIRITGIPESE